MDTFSFNLLLCQFALGDREKMKKAFLRLLALRLDTAGDDERYMNLHDDKETAAILEAFKSDKLREREIAELHYAEKIIMTSAKLIAPGKRS